MPHRVVSFPSPIELQGEKAAVADACWLFQRAAMKLTDVTGEDEAEK